MSMIPNLGFEAKVSREADLALGPISHIALEDARRAAFIYYRVLQANTARGCLN